MKSFLPILFFCMSTALQATTMTLYYSPHCPYSIAVLDYLDQIDKTVPLKDVSSSPAIKQELQQIGGKSQVPCLVIDGKALYDSQAIIDWMQEHQDLLSSQ